MIDEINYMVIPGLVIVVDHGGAEASGRVDAGASDGDGGQMNHEHREPNWKWGQHLHLRSINNSYIYL